MNHLDNSQLKASKEIKIQWLDELVAEGKDAYELNNISAMKFYFKNQPSYFYVVESSRMYDSGFGRNWKQQCKLGGDSSAIWQYIYHLDEREYLCFNDVYDALSNEYYSFIASNGEDSFEDTVLSLKSEDTQVLIKFMEHLEKNLAQMSLLYYTGYSNREVILQAVLLIYSTDRKFFDAHIDIDFDSFDKISETLMPSVAIKEYLKDKLTLELSTKLNVKEKLVKV